MASPFSGRAGRQAAMWTADYLGGSTGRINSYYDKGLSSSLNSLGQARDTYNTALTNQKDAINTGADSAINRLGEAKGYYQPAYDRGEQAAGTYQDSLGLNGAEGNARAVNSFQAGPAYQWQRDQATDAAARKASALGMGASGNTLTALATLGSNLANKEFGGWQDRLRGVSDQGMQAANGLAGLTSQQAGYDYGRGQSLSNAYGENARGVAGTYGAEAGLYSQDASNRANTEQWAANQIVSAGQNGMMAGQNAASNRFQAGMSIANLGASLLGGAMGGGWGGAAGRFASNVASGGFNGTSQNYSYGAGGYTGQGPFW